MVVPGRKLGLLAAIGLVLVALLLASCTNTPSTSNSPTMSLRTSTSMGSTTLSGVQTSTSTSASTTETSTSTSTSPATGSLDYFKAHHELEALLQEDDLRMPQLAMDINRTAPDIPQAVDDEIRNMFIALQQAEMTLRQIPDIPPGFRQAHDLLLQAANYMLMRINQTGIAVQDILNSGDPTSGNPQFQVARNYRDYYRQTFAEYQAALPRVVPTLTTTAGIHPLSELDWPKEGLQPEAVMRVLHEELGTGIVPIYLPKTLPSGFWAGPDFVFEQATGGHLPNPHVWNQVLGERAGYGVTFTEVVVTGVTFSEVVDTVTVWVNPAADAGEGEWQQSDIPFEGGFFSFQEVAPAFLQAPGAKGSVVVVDGTMPDAVREVARQLVRVE